MPYGSKPPSLHTSREPVHATAPASELSPHNIRSHALADRWRSHGHHLPVERQVRHDPLQPRVLVLKLLQPPHLVGQQPTILLLPGKIGRLADPGLPTDLGNRRAFLALLQDERLSRDSVNFDAFIVLNSCPRRGRLAENSSSKRSSFEGAEHALRSEYGLIHLGCAGEKDMRSYGRPASAFAWGTRA